MSSTDAPAGDVQDNSYVNRPGQNEYNVPVVKDDTAAATEEEGGYTDESTADSDAQLGMYILSLSPLLPLSFYFTHTQTHQPSFFFFLLSFPSISHSPTHTPTPNNSKRRSRHRQNQHSRIENSWSSKEGSRILHRAGR